MVCRNGYLISAELKEKYRDHINDNTLTSIASLSEKQTGYKASVLCTGADKVDL